MSRVVIKAKVKEAHFQDYIDLGCLQKIIGDAQSNLRENALWIGYMKTKYNIRRA